LNKQVLVHLTIVVRVPTGSIDEAQVVRNFNKANACLDQSTSQQAALTELASITPAKRSRFPIPDSRFRSKFRVKVGPASLKASS
jgi:hypothetical protein